MDMSKRSEAIITSAKETLSGTSWPCLSDFCHFDKITLSHFGPLREIRKAYRKHKKKLLSGNLAYIFLNTSLQTLFFWPEEERSITRTPCWGNVHIAHILPWASTAIVLMLSLQSGRHQAPSGICREIYRLISY